MKAYEVYLFCFERIFSKPLSIPLLIFIFDFRVVFLTAAHAQPRLRSELYYAYIEELNTGS